MANFKDISRQQNFIEYKNIKCLFYDLCIQNGSLGILSGIDSEGNISYESAEKYFGDVTLDSGERIQITQDILDCMELGYAITLHKA